MLSTEDNELLCRSGRGTLMGDLLRQYWLPALPSRELPEPDGEPKQVRLLGEDLVAFRDTQGAVGLMAANCPHRGASLFFGRNEECGLRCVYHGWKFDVTGGCVDMPNEPAESDFKHKVGRAPIRATRSTASSGPTWAPRETPPPFPPFEITTLPADHVYPPLMMLRGVQLGAGARGRHRLRPHRLGARQGAPRKHAARHAGTATKRPRLDVLRDRLRRVLLGAAAHWDVEGTSGTASPSSSRRASP